ncbi:DUF5986 family protein [Macrococcus caseolyticus]|uniref:DUF5986 family protein n=1 Tax=Macrococcoides caseolyticum TaxID=69966 RepID=UPI002DB8EF93|nr:DUF5986 family protein [Macrococcus caseolyticus]MEB8171624.1 DUF5986 family protein [Macrococcus caseolyticus]
MIQISEDKLKQIVDWCTIPDYDAIRLQEKSVGKIGPQNVHNSKGQASWDTIYNNIVNNCDNHDLLAVKISRGNIWEAIGIYDEGVEELFLVFRLPNLKKIMKSPYNCHYAPLANVGNGMLKPKQMELIDDSLYDSEIVIEYERLSEELFEKMGIRPKKVILCGFTLYQFKAYLYNKSQQLVWEDNYSRMIDTQYENLGGEQSLSNSVIKDNKKYKIKTKKPKSRIKGLKKI